MGRQGVMKVARIGATAAAVVAMCGALAMARADDLASDPVRQRAEDIAQAASGGLDDFLRPQQVAQAQTGKQSPAEKGATPTDKKAQPVTTVPDKAAEKSGQSG